MSMKTIIAYPPVNEDVHPDLPILERCPHVFPFELIGLGDAHASLALGFHVTLVFQPEDDKGSFLLGEKRRGFREIMEKEERGKGNDNLDHLVQRQDEK